MLVCAIASVVVFRVLRGTSHRLLAFIRNREDNRRQRRMFHLFKSRENNICNLTLCSEYSAKPPRLSPVQVFKSLTCTIIIQASSPKRFQI